MASGPIIPFLIVGQSLAEGRGVTPSPYFLPPGMMRRYYAGIPGGVTDDLVDPAYPGHTTAGSMWPSFGWHLFYGFGGMVPLCFVFACQGGSAVCATAQLNPASGNWDVSGALRYAADAAMTAAMAQLVVEGYTPALARVISMPGQTDAIALHSGIITPTDYIMAQLGLAAWFRTRSWGHSTMPFYCCSVGDSYYDPPRIDDFKTIQNCMERCANDDPFFKPILRPLRTASQRGLTPVNDIHPNQVGNDNFGRLAAQAVLSGGTDPVARTINANGGMGLPDANYTWFNPDIPPVIG